MIHYRDDHTTIEINGRVVVVLPHPANEIERAQELHALFPEVEGWYHCRYSVNQMARGCKGADAIAVAAAARLAAAPGSKPAPVAAAGLFDAEAAAV